MDGFCEDYHLLFPREFFMIFVDEFYQSQEYYCSWISLMWNVSWTHLSNPSLCRETQVAVHPTDERSTMSRDDSIRTNLSHTQM